MFGYIRSEIDKHTALAVDPVGSNCAVIEANLVLNGLSCNIENCAISNSDEAVSFSKGSCGHILVSRGHRLLWSGSTDGQIVPYEGEPVIELVTLVELRDS